MTCDEIALDTGSVNELLRGIGERAFSDETLAAFRRIMA